MEMEMECEQSHLKYKKTNCTNSKHTHTHTFTAFILKWWFDQMYMFIIVIYLYTFFTCSSEWVNCNVLAAWLMIICFAYNSVSHSHSLSLLARFFPFCVLPFSSLLLVLFLFIFAFIGLCFGKISVCYAFYMWYSLAIFSSDWFTQFTFCVRSAHEELVCSNKMYRHLYIMHIQQQ